MITSSIIISSCNYVYIYIYIYVHACVGARLAIACSKPRDIALPHGRG